MSSITAIGTANPRYKIAQQDIFRFMANAFRLDEVNISRLKTIYDHAGIEQRYSVIPDFGCDDPSQFSFFEANADLEPFISTERRLKIYQQEAVAIAVAAVKDCLREDEALYSQITHLITVSCTGMYAPGLDIDLVEHLNLNRRTERICINFMGCYGAINALKTADYICRADPNAKVLVVSVELCTLHFQKQNTLDNWVANSLFSDGAAAALVEAGERGRPSLKLRDFYSEFLPEARNEMGWYIGNTGFEMRLTSKVSKQIKQAIRPVYQNLLDHAGLKSDEIGAYAIHPGGVKILEAVEQALELPEESNAIAYEVLRDFGNMSSATILFVLKKFLHQPQLTSRYIAGFAFGPGLTVEGMILQPA